MGLAKLYNNLERLEKLAINVIKIEYKLNKILTTLYKDKDFKAWVIDLNTNEQLYKGINAFGVTLESIGGGYSGITIEYKKEKRQPFDRVTLKDTGKFYKSFKVQVGKGDFTITANTQIHGNDLTRDWGKDIIGLTNENIEKVSKYIINKITQPLLEAILQGV